MAYLEQSVSAPLHRSHPLRVAALFLFAALLSATLPFVEHAYVYAVVFGMLLCLAVPFWAKWQHRRHDWFESLNIVGLLQFVYFGLGTIFVLRNPTDVAYDRYIVPYIPQAATYCLFGYVALLVGYLGPWWPRRTTQRGRLVPKGSVFLLIPAAVGFVGQFAGSAWQWAVKFGITLSVGVSTLAQFSGLFTFALALGWLLVLSGQATRAQRTALFLFLLPATGALLLMALNNKSLTMTLIGLPLVSLWYARRKIPWATLLVLFLILVFVIFPFHNTYRMFEEQISPSQRFALTKSLMAKWDLDEYMDMSLGTFMARVALINSVAVVLRDVGRWVPYANGRTLFLPMVVFFVPRLIWPDKPMMQAGREFGQTFRVVGALDNETHIASSVPGELYWNFDLPGIILGMALWGFVLRFLYRRYGEGGKSDPVRLAVHIVLVVQFAHFEGGLASQLVGVIRTLMLFEGYFWISRRLGHLERRPVFGARP